VQFIDHYVFKLLYSVVCVTCFKCVALLVTIVSYIQIVVQVQWYSVVVNYWTRTWRWVLCLVDKQATLNKLQTYYVQSTQANSAFYSHWDGKWVVAYLLWAVGWRLTGTVVCLQSALWVQLSINAANWLPHCSTVSSCQSTAASEIVKCCWSRVCKYCCYKYPELYFYAYMHTELICVCIYCLVLLLLIGTVRRIHGRFI